jgi:hypothetical protein
VEGLHDVKQEIPFGQQAAVLATPPIAYLQEVMMVPDESLWALLLTFGMLT